MNKSSLCVITGLLVSVVVLIGISSVYPSVDDLWVENPLWNGLSQFYVMLQPTRMQDYTLLKVILEPQDSTLFIIGPSKEFTEPEVESITTYLARGGTLVLADDFGTGNQLLESLELDSRFEGGLLRDPVFHEKNSLMPIIVSTSITGVSSVILNYATTLNVDKQRVILWSSPLSYTVDEINETPEELISKPVLAKLPELGGTIILISDSSIFINSMITRGNNQGLLESIAKENVIIDEAHSYQSLLSKFKFVLATTYTALGYYEIRYGICILGTATILWLRLKVEDSPENQVEKVLGRYPEYNREQVQWLHDERRKANGKL